MRCRTRAGVDRLGFTVLLPMVLAILAIVVIFAFGQQHRMGVALQNEGLASGQRAYLLAESALQEAILDFASTMNVPSQDDESWFRRMRLSVVKGRQRYVSSFFTPHRTPALYDGKGMRLDDVNVTIWAHAPLGDSDFDTCGLATFTTTVGVPRRVSGLRGKKVFRNMQKTCEFKQVLVTPPPPLDDSPLYIERFDHLREARQQYDALRDPLQGDTEASGDAVRAFPVFRRDDEPLSNPVRIEGPQITSGELQLSLPRATGTTGGASDGLVATIDGELRRHECLVRLVPSRQINRFLRSASAIRCDAWLARASRAFADAESFTRASVRGDTLRLDGVVAVKGALTLRCSKYAGCGVVVATGDLHVGGLSAAGPSLLTLVSGGDIRLSGTVEAALLAPHGTVRFGGATVKGLVYESHHAGEPFTIVYDERYRSLRQGGGVAAEHLWITLSPYEIANHFLRKEDPQWSELATGASP